MSGQQYDAEKDAGITDAQIEWREQIGQRLMLTMTCQHGSDYFGTGAVCETCFANVQRIGHLIERIAAQAWDQGRAAERRDWEFTADLSTPDEDRRPLANPYRVTPPAQTGGAAAEWLDQFAASDQRPGARPARYDHEDAARAIEWTWFGWDPRRTTLLPAETDD